MSRESLAAMMTGVAFDAAPRPKLIANNTVQYYRNGRRVIRLHQTDILEFDGPVCTITTEGWQTVTTKDRINKYSPIRISSQRGLWYVGETLFYDGIKICDGKPPAANLKRERKANKLAESIRKFVAKVDKLDSLPQPDNGDCWYCSMFDRAQPADKSDYGVGNKTGKRSTNCKHIRSHVRYGYLHGSLIVNAMRWCGETDMLISWAFNDPRKQWRRNVKRDLRRYLRSQLGLPT